MVGPDLDHHVAGGHAVVASAMADAVLAGREQALNNVVEAAKGDEEFVEVSEEPATE